MFILDSISMYPELFNKKIKKIVLSPHYDDFVLSLGGLILELAKKKCRIEDWIIFSNSNHIARDYEGNKDVSRQRIKTVSNTRFKEELRAAKEIGNVKIKLCKLNEALIRGHWKEHPHGFPYGFEEIKDRLEMEKTRKMLKSLLSKNVQIFVPLAIQEHIDHFIVRQAIQDLIDHKNRTCQIFFYEDLPYAAHATEKEWKNINNFIRTNNLFPIIIPIDLSLKLKLLDFYESQTYEHYYEDVRKHANGIKNKRMPCERIYLFGN